MRWDVRHKIDYINWKKETVHENVNQETFEHILEECKKIRHKAETKTLRSEWRKGDCYLAEKVGYSYQLTFFDGERYRFYWTNWIDDTKNTGKPIRRGTDAIQAVAYKFKEFSKGKTLKGAFGYTDDEFLRCIPKQFYYLDESQRNKVIYPISAVDATAQYPSNICGALPDSHGALQFYGTIKPSEDYPFAFYIKSGHSAEYGVYDTHTWVDHKLNTWLFGENIRFIDPEEDITVLMPASKYELTEVYKYFFSVRKKDEEAKFAMNASIGAMHRRQYINFKLAHLVSVCLCRSNQKILDLIDKIGVKYIIHAAVDGLIYRGQKEYGIKEKLMSTFHQEFTGCEGLIIGANQYIIKDKPGGSVIKCKHGSFDQCTDGSDIDHPTDYTDALKWIRKKKIKEIKLYAEDDTRPTNP